MLSEFLGSIDTKFAVHFSNLLCMFFPQDECIYISQPIYHIASINGQFYL